MVLRNKGNTDIPVKLPKIVVEEPDRYPRPAPANNLDTPQKTSSKTPPLTLKDIGKLLASAIGGSFR